MSTLSSNDFFRIISDGEKIVFLRDSGKERECIVYENPLLTRFNIDIRRDSIDVSECRRDGVREYTSGPIDYSIDLSLQGGIIKYVDRPLIMGVDLFSRYSVTDYLNIINEKISHRSK